MITAELQAKINLWRAKMADGTLTVEELKEAVRAMREGRLTASAASDSSRRKVAKAAIPSADDMLGELADL